VTGIAYVQFGDRYTTMPAADRAECLLDEHNKMFIRWVDKTIGSQKLDAHMWRSPVVAAMNATFQKNKKDADAFWTLVRDGSGPNHKSPDRVLNKFLLTKYVNKAGGVTSRSAKALAAPREMYVKCLHAWNAWRKDTTTDLKYHAQGKIPAAV
jgi:hypothetical protein